MNETERFSHVAVAGAGAWGTALANVAARAGRRVTLWGRDAAALAAMAADSTNARHLPGIAIESGVSVTSDPKELVHADLLLLVIPTQNMRAAAASLQPFLRPGVPAVICAKGIERGTNLFVSGILNEVLPANPAAILSGPSFAHDVAKGLPTAVTVAAGNIALARAICEALATQTLRLYHSDDIRGVEIGGAAKNVLAIACGIASGRALGASANAALIARGFAELTRFALAFGARSETLMGLSGLGDLVLTCSGPQSRNFAFGLALGQGRSVAEASGGKLAEGAFTASALVEMAGAKGVDMPIARAVDAVLQGRLDIEGAIEALLNRPFRSEG